MGEMRHAATWSETRPSRGYLSSPLSVPLPSMSEAFLETPAGGELDVSHSSSSPSKLVVRRTFIECVNEETERMRDQRHRSDPAVPCFLSEASEETFGHAFSSSSLTRKDEDEYGMMLNEDSDDGSVFDCGICCAEESEAFDKSIPLEDTFGTASEDLSPNRFVVKRTFLELAEDHVPQERNRSVSMPVAGSINQEPGAPSLTEQLLERMRLSQSERDRISLNLRERHAQAGSTQVEEEEEDEQGLPFGGARSEPALGRKDTAASSCKQQSPQGRHKPATEAAPSVRFAPEAVPVPQKLLNASASSTPRSIERVDSGIDFDTMRSMDSRTSQMTNDSEAVSEFPPDDVEPDPSLGPKTTVMLRNLPSNYTRLMLMSLLDKEGFPALYDFVYLPIDFGSRSGFGYAFINLADEETALRFRAHFQGFTGWDMPCAKVAEVTWSGTHQGLEQHVNRYRNSPVMHETMPDECKPIILKDGVRMEFPPPTKALRPPRIRPSKNRRAGAAAQKAERTQAERTLRSN